MKLYEYLCYEKPDLLKYVIIADSKEEALDLFMQSKPKSIEITYYDSESLHLSNGLKFDIFELGEVKKGIY